MSNKKTIEFKVEIGQIFKDDKRDNVIIDKEYRKKKHGKSMVNEKWYKYTCNVCGWTGGWIVESNLLKLEQGCSCCRGLTVAKGINDIATSHPHLVKYFKNTEDVYTHSYASNKKVWIKCTDCGFEKEMIINNFCKQGFICKKCSNGEKYPNKFMFNVLEQLNIIFETEYSPQWIGRKRYDFYIPSLNIIIEMDGGLGHGKNDNNMNGQTKEESKAIDDYKDEQARLHGITVIRIDCDYGKLENRFEYIKKSISYKLRDIIHINKIDWNKCNEYGISNLVKIACKHKNNNPYLTTTEIGKLMGGYNKVTICRWLKQGNGIWCDYDPKKEMKKNNSKNGKLGCKSIEILKDGISLGIFESVTELEKQSEKLFGVKLLSSNISSVCLGKKIKYKDFFFRYINRKYEN